ncbi:MAG: hypothetical protein M0R80_13185 [Proteobacteria bacterium]|jgi:hypothetical protein|nr:hypothetical protein [Pseudomonadota bacterium]
MEKEKQTKEVKPCKEKGCTNDALANQEYCRKHLNDKWYEEYKSRGYTNGR